MKWLALTAASLILAGAAAFRRRTRERTIRRDAVTRHLSVVRAEGARVL